MYKLSQLTQYRYAEGFGSPVAERNRFRALATDQKDVRVKVLVCFIGEDSRKAGQPYWVPLNTVSDSILRFYISVFGVKPGQKLFQHSAKYLADRIKTIMAKVFGTNASVDEMLRCEIRNEAFSTHQARNMLERYIEANYHGSDKHEVQAVVLGHKMKRDKGSPTSDIYSNFLDTCESKIATLRRIKDLDPRTPEQIEFDKLHKRFDKSERLLERAHEEVKQGREDNESFHERALEGFKFLAQLMAMSEEQRIAFFTQYGINPAFDLEAQFKMIATKE